MYFKIYLLQILIKIHIEIFLGHFSFKDFAGHERNGDLLLRHLSGC